MGASGGEEGESGASVGEGGEPGGTQTRVGVLGVAASVGGHARLAWSPP